MYYHSKNSATVYYIILGLLILFSFFTFSAQFYPLLNSDMAVSILMTPGFSIPGDLYFWGQNHEGSLIPMLAQILCSTYRFPPILAVSVVHYLILIAGFFALASLFKDRSLKIALAFIWFFPSWHFLDHVLFQPGILISLLAISIYFLNRLSQVYTMRLKLVWLSMACMSFFIAVWVSDVAIFSLVVFILGISWQNRKKFTGHYISALKKEKNNLILWLISVIWFIAGAICILYAKSKGVRAESYHQNFLNNPGEIGEKISAVIGALFHVFTFGSENVLESIYAWSILIGVPLTFLMTKKKNAPSQVFTQQRWLTFFFMNGIAMVLLVILFHWVFINGAGRRYFAIIYISFWVTFLLFLQANGSKNRPLRLTLLYIVIFSGVLSSFYQFYFPQRIPPRAEVLNEFLSLGNVGLIAAYQNAYLSASIDPGHIKAIPHDQDEVRNRGLVEEVFKQPKIYLIKDCWMDSFPDTIQQFGHILIKMGNMLHLADYDLCRYIPLLLHEEFSWAEMKYQGIVDEDEDARTRRSIHIDPGFDRSKHFVYGPFISLSPGKVVVRFRIKSNENLSTAKLAYLDISADYGKIILGSRTIQASDFGRPNTFQEFEIPLELTKKYDGIEFRILYLGNSILSFDRVEVQGI